MLAFVSSSDPGLRSSPADFGTRIVDQSLIVPSKVASVLERLSIRNLVQLLSYLNTYPNTVARELDWSVADVLAARAALVKQLQGHVPSAILENRPPVRRGMGARNPARVR